MATKAKSVHVFKIELWSKEYYGNNKRNINIYEGKVTNAKSKKVVFIHSPAELLECLELMYEQEELKWKLKQ